jgi:hypothetical protein
MHPSYGSFTGAVDDVFDDLQAILQGADDTLPSTAPDRANSPLTTELDAVVLQIPKDEHGCVKQLSSSTSIFTQTADPVDSNIKKNRRGRRLDRKDSFSKTGCGDGTYESESTVTAVSVPSIVNMVCSAKDDVLAASDAKSQVDVTVENADDSDCTSSVMHREYFSHVRRVNLENLSLVIGSNLPVYQVIQPSI